MTGQDLLSNAAQELARRGLAGPGDRGHAGAGAVDHRSALIARCTSVDDVQAVVGIAREHGLALKVRGGGRSVRARTTPDAGLVADLSPLKAIAVDPGARTVRAGAGVTWGELDAATQAHGLAVTGARHSAIGVAGHTLGGGTGWLARKLGTTADNLLSAEVVTADGLATTAGPDEVVGAAGSGVVTALELRLHPVGPIVYGGLMLSEPERAGRILRYARRLMSGAPEDLGLGVTFMSAPPEPFVAPELHHQPMVGVIVCWTGGIVEGEGVISTLREVAQPVIDMVQPLPYLALQSMLDAGAPDGARVHVEAGFLGELSDAAIDQLALHGATRPAPPAQLMLEPLGDAAWRYHAVALWTDPRPAADEAQVAWARGVAGDLGPVGAG